MQIAHMMGTSTASALEAIYGEDKKNKSTQQNTVHSWQEDSVSLSPEALQAYSMMRLNLQEQPNVDGLNEEEKQLLGEAGNEAPEAGASQNSGSSAAEIEAKIKELQQKMSQILSSGMPEATKNAMSSSIQAQINQLMQELNALVAKTK